MKVTVGNSISKVEGFTPQQLSGLRGELCYTPKHSPFVQTYRQALIDKKGHFPTGLLNRLVAFCTGKNWPLDVLDARIQVPRAKNDFKLSLGVTPYPEQTNAVAACLEANRGILSCPTGFGKSVVIALLIKELNRRALVIVPNLALKEQLTNSLRICFPGLEVGGFGSYLAVDNIDALESKKTNPGYDVMIVDEYHHAAAKTYRKVNKIIGASIYFKFGLTATPFRSQEAEDILMECMLSEVIYKVPHSHAVDRGLICPVEAYYHDLPKTQYNGVTWRQIYQEAIIQNMGRNVIIASQMQILKEANAITLCLVKEIEHGKILSDLTGVPFANGESEDCKQLIAAFSKGEINSLIGTAGVLGEGVDTKPAEYIIIAGLGKAKNSFLQWVGRGFRIYPGKESCKVVLFRDAGHKWTKDHFNAQKKILKDEFGIEAIKL